MELTRNSSLAIVGMVFAQLVVQYQDDPVGFAREAEIAFRNFNEKERGIIAGAFSMLGLCGDYLTPEGQMKIALEWTLGKIIDGADI